MPPVAAAGGGGLCGGDALLENQIQKLEESRSKLGEEPGHPAEWCGRGPGWGGTRAAAGVYLT